MALSTITAVLYARKRDATTPREPTRTRAILPGRFSKKKGSHEGGRVAGAGEDGGRGGAGAGVGRRGANGAPRRRRNLRLGGRGIPGQDGQPCPAPGDGPRVRRHGRRDRRGRGRGPRRTRRGREPALVGRDVPPVPDGPDEPLPEADPDRHPPPRRLRGARASPRPQRLPAAPGPPRPRAHRGARRAPGKRGPRDTAGHGRREHRRARGRDRGREHRPDVPAGRRPLGHPERTRRRAARGTPGGGAGAGGARIRAAGAGGAEGGYGGARGRPGYRRRGRGGDAPDGHRDAFAAGGRAVMVGLHDDGTTLHFHGVVRGQFDLQGSYAYTAEDYEQALEWLVEGRAGIGALPPVLPLERGPEAFVELVRGPSAQVKVFLAGTEG